MKIAFTAMLFLSWEQLTKHTKGKFISSSYILIVMIPVLANMLSKMPASITINEIVFKLNLPFSWYYLYFSAVAFFCAKLLYIFIAPSIYKENTSYNDFIKKERSKKHLEYYAKDGFFVDLEFYYKYDDIESNKEDTKNLFWNIWNELNYKLKFRRFILSTLIVIGYFFLIIVIIENFIFVLESFNDVYNNSSLSIIFNRLWIVLMS